MDLPGVFTVKNLEDGRRIKEFLRKRKAERAVILGMGYIALEMTEALVDLGVAVDLVKPRVGLLPWLHRELAKPVRELLKARGVGLFDGHRVDRITADGDRLTVHAGDLALSADLVIAAIGVRPCASLAEQAGLELSVGGSIATDRTLRTSDPEIFAAGDCADSFHVVTGAKTWIPLALRANRAGWAVADNVCGGRVELPGVAAPPCSRCSTCRWRAPGSPRTRRRRRASTRWRCRSARGRGPASIPGPGRCTWPWLATGRAVACSARS